MKLDLTNKTFNRLTGIKYLYVEKHGSVLWLCKCICGKERIVKASSLKSGRVKSCGCLVKEQLKDLHTHAKLSLGEASFNSIYRTYKRNASNRNLLFELNKIDFKYLLKQNCYYCNSEPKLVQKSTHNNGNFIYNGIDRVDNNKGYVLDNCVSCCRSCNISKHNITKKIIFKAYEFLNKE